MRAGQREEESTVMPDRSSHGSQLQHLRVRDCMHAGVLTCSADTPLGEVAGIMTKHRVHAVAVIDDKRRPIGLVSALDVVEAAGRDEHERVTARVATATEPLITIYARHRGLGRREQRGMSLLQSWPKASGKPAARRHRKLDRG